jgi:predicted DNA-binding transcriptional regulator YafY
MPVNKNKLLRMGVIIEMMRKGALPNYTRFMEEMRSRDPAGAYRLSSKTFLRDIDDLKAEFGAPIDYDASARGFFLRDKEWYSENLLAEPFDMQGVILAQKAAASLMPEPLRSSINKAVRTLLTRKSSGFSDKAELEMMQIINPVQLPLSIEIFCTVYEAWERRQKLRLSYRSAKEVQSEMVFEPHVLAWLSGIWYLKGMLCGTEKFSYRKPYQTVLAVHRIQQAERIFGSFQGSQDLLATVKKGNLFEFPRIPELRLRFLAELSLQVRERFANDPTRIKEEKDGSLLVTLQELTDYEAVDLVMWARGQVQVIEPESLRLEIMQIAETMLKNQQGQSMD